MKLAIRIIVGIIIVLLIISFIMFPTLYSILVRKIYWFELLFLTLIVAGYGVSSTLILRIALALNLLGAVLNIFVFVV